MPTFICSTNNSVIGCAARLGEESDPDVVVVHISSFNDAKSIVLTPDEAMRLGNAILADAQSLQKRLPVRPPQGSE